MAESPNLEAGGQQHLWDHKGHKRHSTKPSSPPESVDQSESHPIANLSLSLDQPLRKISHLPRASTNPSSGKAACPGPPTRTQAWTSDPPLLKEERSKSSDASLSPSSSLNQHKRRLLVLKNIHRSWPSSGVPGMSSTGKR